MKINKREDGTISAICAIKDIENNTKQTLEIMAAYNEETKTNKALPNNECHFYYVGKTDKCPGPRNE